MQRVEQQPPDDAWSVALLAWAMRAADAIAVAERNEGDRPHELARPGRPVAVPTAGRYPRIALRPRATAAARPDPTVRIGGSAA